MIEFQKARQLILDHCPQMPIEKRSIEECLGYTLANEIKALDPSPLFDNSAMDGYAVLVGDVNEASPENPVSLVIQRTVQAGQPASISLEQGKAVKIFTGAPLPVNAEAVIMRENVEELQDKITVTQQVHVGENIRKKGEEYDGGEVIFSAGKLITPPVAGMLATLGYTEVMVFSKPKVGVLITGNELLPPGKPLLPGQIRDSNSYTMSAVLQAIGIRPVEIRRVSDDEVKLSKAFFDMLQKSDVVISVGGVSMGDYDLVKAVVEKMGASTIFWKVAMKPGKPNYFATIGNKLIFGLPGNPVSAALSFHLLVKPAMNTMSGISSASYMVLKARLLSGVEKKTGRLEFLRGNYHTDSHGELVVKPEKSQGSHMLTGLANANCLIYFPRAMSVLEEGQTVEIEPLQWGIL
jgi:molybdopterin molybdotransferase